MPDPTPSPAPQPGATPAPTPAPVPNPIAAAPSPTPNPAPTPEPAQAWGDNWRQTYAGEDAKLLARLERYQSPKAALDALIAAQNRISSGELRKPLGENASSEEVASYRQQNGIPEKPEGYFEKLPEGLVIGAEDKPLFENFAKGLHALNADPKIAHYAVKWYNDFLDEQGAKTVEADTSQKTEVEDALRAEWGNDYRANINHIHGFLSSAPEGVAALVMNARGPDGRAILNDAHVVRWLASVSRELNPVGTIVPGSGGTSTATIDTEITGIEKLMGDRSSAYWKGPEASKMQARYRDLIDARETLKKRNAA